MPTFNGTPGDDFLAGTNFDDDLHGFDGNDGLFGLDGNDLLDGGNGHDFMRGQDGNDQIFGGADDDYLDGGDGDDLLDGGSGLDRVSFAVGAVVGVTVDLNIQGVAQNTGHGLDTLVGIEHLSGTRFNDILTGNGGDNWLWGGSDGSGVTGDDVIAAGGGNDLVEVGTGNHTLDGGTGNDTLSLWGNNSDITAAGVTFSLLLQGAAQDTGQGMMNASGFENLSGSIHADILTGDGNDNVIAGDLDDDQLSGGNGSDTLYGDGRIIVDTHDTGGSGPITTYADITLIDPLLVPGNDTLEGGDGDDTLHGGGGSDTASYVSAGGGVFVDLAFGGASGAAGEDVFFSIENAIGSAFDDGLLGSGGDNALAGLGGHDFLRGFDGNDTLKGGDGDDFLNGGVGDDIVDGGAGIDRAAYSTGALAGVTVDLNIDGVAQNTGSQGFDTLMDIEHVSGTRFNDVLSGDASDNYVWGGTDGSGVTGDDILSGGAGNDLVQVGNGNHNASGGAGAADTLSLHGNGTDITAAGVTVSLLLQGMAQATEQGMMTLTGFENLSGSAFDDVLGGDGNANLLAGYSGADSLSGGDGADTLYGDGLVIIDTHDTGGSGPIVTYVDVADLAVPEAGGNDILNGGKGNDTLWGGGGDDVLTGGKGNDTFGFGPGDGDDRVTDFEKNKDTIFFDGIAGVDDFGDLVFTKVGSDVLITWATTDSILLEGVKLNQIHASDFMFG